MRSPGLCLMRSTVSSRYRPSLATVSHLCTGLLCVLLAAFALLLVYARADLPTIGRAVSGGMHSHQSGSPRADHGEGRSLERERKLGAAGDVAAR